MTSPPTMAQVARLAGVSTATVSRALGPQYTTVSPEVRERIQRVVAELHYHPNRLPRNMRAKSSRVLGLVISDIGNPFFTAIVRGCEDVAQRDGYSLVLTNSDEDPERETARLLTMAEERVAGVILASTGVRTQGLETLQAMGIPVLALDRLIEETTVDAVVVDNESAAYEAVRHLTNLGHRRISIVVGPTQSSAMLARRQGYERALREQRIPLDPSLVKVGSLREGEGYRLAMELLALESPPTAVFTANNLTTIGVLQAVRARGLAIPTDLSIVGFDDIATGDLLDPPLTVVAQPTYDLGAKAAEVLLARIAEPDAPVRETVLHAQLTIRGSTGSPPSAETRGHA